jgi:enoyl-CoA hydratase
VSDSILLDDPAPGVVRITLNRPAALNAFTFPMYRELTDELRRLQFHATSRVVVLTGAGKGFCSGHDLRNGGRAEWVPEGLGRIQQGKYRMSLMSGLAPLMRALPQPVIAAVNGAAAGIGFTLALAADIAIAASSAKFVNAIHNTGTGAELGLSYLLPRAVGAQKAAELLLTARTVLADEAERIGLVLRTVPDSQLMAETLQLAESIAANTPIGTWLTKQSLHLNQNAGSLEAAIEMENRAVLASQATADAREKTAAALEKRPPRFTNG